MKSVVLVLAILAPGGPLPCAEPRNVQDPPEAVKEAMTRSSEGRFQAALRPLEEQQGLLREDPRAQYVAGTAWMRLHRPDQAKPLLTAAAEKGITGFEGWDSIEALLARIAVTERLRPPLAKGLPQDDRLKCLRVYADDTPWIKAILDVLPRHVACAQEVFGKDLPPIDVYLFQSREDYTAFYKALFSANIPTSWQNGTGNFNVVTFCQVDREGKPVGAPGAARGRGDVLHEYGHALLHTLYGDLYLRHVPQWFDEGVSDFLAKEYYKELFEYSADLIRRAAIVPSLEDLSRHLYERDPSLRYGMARYMVNELLQGREPSVIQDILRRTAAEGKFEDAIQTTTGLGSSDLRTRVIARFR